MPPSKLNTIDQTLIKNLDKLESLEDLEIVNPCMITANMHSDDGTIHEPLTERMVFIFAVKVS